MSRVTVAVQGARLKVPMCPFVVELYLKSYLFKGKLAKKDAVPRDEDTSLHVL